MHTQSGSFSGFIPPGVNGKWVFFLTREVEFRATARFFLCVCVCFFGVFVVFGGVFVLFFVFLRALLREKNDFLAVEYKPKAGFQ